MTSRFIFPREQALDANGHPLTGAKLYFYSTGTTTPTDTYSDAALTTPNANPLVADSAGRFGDAFMTSTATYKVVLKDASDVTIWTADPAPAYLGLGDIAVARSTIGAIGAADANTFTATQTVSSTDAGAAEGPLVVLDRNSASPAASDLLGALRFDARSSSATQRSVAKLAAELLDATNASEDARLLFQTIVAGTLATRAIVGQGIAVGAATDGDKGSGTVNAVEYYKNGTALPLTKSYSSTAQTITSAGTLTLAHGLGTIPLLIQARLVCVTGEVGYSTGDEVMIAVGAHDGAGVNRGVAVIADSTNLTIRYGSNATALLLVHKTAGTTAGATNANWTFHIRAWA